MPEAGLAMVQNAALLLAMAVVYDVTSPRWNRASERLRSVLSGVLLGVIGIAIMLSPLVVVPGVVFDTRSVLLGVTGLVFGLVPALVAMAMTAAFRLFDGGIAAWTGVAVILASGGIGLAWRRMRGAGWVRTPVHEVYLMGLVIHATMLLLMFTLPWQTALTVVGVIAIPLLVIYPVVTALLGTLLLNRARWRRADVELAVSEERLRLALAAAAQGMYDVDLVTGQVAVNDDYARMLGCDPATFRLDLDRWLGLLHPEDRPGAERAYRDYVAGDAPLYRTEFRMRHADGGWVWVLSLGEIVERDASGAPVRMLGTHTDTTARRKAQEELARLNEELESRVRERTEELEAANRELRSFSYSVSHDLRAPLRAISGFATLLSRRHREHLDEQGQHYLDTILASSDHMGVLIEQLLDYSRLGRGAVRAEPVLLGPLVDGVRSTFSERFASEGATLSVTQPLAVPVADAMLLERILVNLVDNALTYRREGVPARITLSATPDGDDVVVSVVDEGIGIAPEFHERVFEVFARLHADDEIPGTGIGLSIVRKAAQLMGSDVTLTSTPGRGCRFSIRLPAADVASVAA